MAAVLHRLHADAIDLNMGCPDASVNKLGAGFRLMEQPEEVRGIVIERKYMRLTPHCKDPAGRRTR